MAIKILPSQGASLEGEEIDFHDSSTGTPAATRLTTGTLTAGDQFQVSKGEYLFVKNGATDSNFTIGTEVRVDGLNLPDRVMTVGANEAMFIKLDGAAYGSPILFAMDSVANVEVAVLRL